MTHSVAVSEVVTTVTAVEDPTSLDTALTNVTVQTTPTVTSVGVSPYIIINEGGSDLLDSGFVFELAADTSVGAGTIVVDHAVGQMFARRNMVAIIDPGSPECEIREVVTTGTSVNLGSSLAFAHAAGDPIYFTGTDDIPISFFGAVGDNTTDCTAAIQAGIDQTYGWGIWLNGFGLSNLYKISAPLFCGTGTRIKNFDIRPTAGYAPIDTTNAMMMSMQDNLRPFTADASTDRITAVMSGLSANNPCAFKAATMPAPLVAGRIYYIRDLDATSFKVSATQGGAAIDLTTAGSGGTLYPEINCMERFYCENLKLNGGGLAGMNGISLNLQQPSYTRDLRVDGCPENSVQITGQISNHYNWEINPAADATNFSIGILLGAVRSNPAHAAGNGINFYGLNMVGADTSNYSCGIYPEGAQNCSVFGAWFETMVHGGVRFGSGYGLLFDGVTGATGGGQPIVKVEATADVNSVGYTLQSGRINSGTGQIVDDDLRSFEVLGSDFTQNAFATIVQPVGSVKPILLDGQASRTRGGTSQQTPGAVSTVNIAHGLTLGGVGIAPTRVSVTPADADARGAPAFHVTTTTTNIVLNFASNLTGGVQYDWHWTAAF